jgi:site-specific DNA-methyltransferase (adenine-specific)
MTSAYHETDKITIYNESCLDVMANMADKSVDLTLTDFPYGNKTEYDVYDDTPEALGALVDAAMPEILRVSKRALITCGVANVHLYPAPRWIMAWVTPAGAGSGPWGFSCWQPILAYGKDPYLQVGLGRRHDYYLKTESSDKKLGNKESDDAHPCPKPLDFWTWLLKRGSVSQDDIIFDPFMGAGTTLMACRNTGRRGIGVELSEAYCARAVEWLERQPPLMEVDGGRGKEKAAWFATQGRMETFS